MPQKLKNLHCRFDTYLVNVKSTVHCSEDLVNFCGLLRKHELYDLVKMVGTTDVYSYCVSKS